MSSHGSDHISSEKHAAAPEIATAAVPVSQVPKVQGKEKKVHNVSFGVLPRCVSIDLESIR